MGPGLFLGKVDAASLDTLRRRVISDMNIVGTRDDSIQFRKFCDFLKKRKGGLAYRPLGAI